ncbi:MAG: aromatic ring-hydroxylating dioxygenase subunit alpha [Myxococcales bacterium]|nr:aromatic ring-hydroxylating dioxygenase subunit alpha [Myxococcales bacterium]
MSSRYTKPIQPPPSFAEAKNTRQKVRAAGMDPNYWYPAEWSKNVKAGGVQEVVFWKRSIAVFRGEDGQIRAVENRCAHRQLKLTTGHVDGCNLVCPYHGWAYDGDGRVVEIPHSLFGRKFPKFKVPEVPVQERYGLIWIFPGDVERAQSVALPVVPELEGPDAWPSISADFTWKAHHSMIIDNVSDFTHAYLHRRFRPFEDAELRKYETVGDNVYLEYDTKVGQGRFNKLFVSRKRVNTNYMRLGYEYPYQWSNTDDQIKHWLFVLPIDERTTRGFFVFYFKAFNIPFTSFEIPKGLMKAFLPAAKELTVKPLLSEDGLAVEAEQEGYEMHWDAPLAELNPVVKAFQEVTIRKWEAYLASQGEGGLTQIGTKPASSEGASPA